MSRIFKLELIRHSIKKVIIAPKISNFFSKSFTNLILMYFIVFYNYETYLNNYTTSILMLRIHTLLDILYTVKV